MRLTDRKMDTFNKYMSILIVKTVLNVWPSDENMIKRLTSFWMIEIFTRDFPTKLCSVYYIFVLTDFASKKSFELEFATKWLFEIVS